MSVTHHTHKLSYQNTHCDVTHKHTHTHTYTPHIHTETWFILHIHWLSSEHVKSSMVYWATIVLPFCVTSLCTLWTSSRYYTMHSIPTFSVYLFHLKKWRSAWEKENKRRECVEIGLLAVFHHVCSMVSRGLVPHSTSLWHSVRVIHILLVTLLPCYTHIIFIFISHVFSLILFRLSYVQ